MRIDLDPATTVAVLAILALFGIGYNALTAEIERRVPDHGYAAFLVAGGVIATLAGAAFLIGLTDALIVGMCFIASGFPMICGSASRWISQRSQSRSSTASDINELLGLES